MKILVLAWEFPPRLVGGIARHVAELYPELIKLGHEVHLITLETDSSPTKEIVDGIHIYRISTPTESNLCDWVARMNDTMGEVGGQIIQAQGGFDLIHAHDWLVGDAAIALKYHFKIPLIATIHATEFGRHGGIYNPQSQCIFDKEKALTHESWRIIVCSQYMQGEINRTLSSPIDKIDVIYNGIIAHKKPQLPSEEFRYIRHQYATEEEKIVYYVGRMTPEKGLYVLIDAIPRVLAQLYHQVKFVFIGGGNISRWQIYARDRGVDDKCIFTGFMSDENLDRFQTIADCAVFPSLYEPFGIVALESFAARVPVVVSDAGGLAEIVKHKETGIITLRNNPDSLAWGIIEVLKNDQLSKQLVEKAYNELSARFNWDDLAQKTIAVYQRVLRERRVSNW